MTSVRQRKMKKNPKLKVKRKVAKSKKKVTYKGHHLLKEDWSVTSSLGENYQKMGLISRLNGNQRAPHNKFWLGVPSYTGNETENDSTEENKGKGKNEDEDEDEFAEIDAILNTGDKKSNNYMFKDEEIKQMSKQELQKIIPKGFALIQRDASGKVEKVVMNEDDDPEQEDEFDDDDKEMLTVAPKTEIAARLESYSQNVPKRERWCSDGQLSFAQEMINKHGLDYQAMFWDAKLNVNQHSAKQIERKIKTFLKSMGQ